MAEPLFFSLDQALLIHTDQIRPYGGSHGLRDLGLLSSALAMPRASFGGVYLHTSLAEMAAAYLFHIAPNHPFLDGNKRAALATVLAFLSHGHVLRQRRRASDSGTRGIWERTPLPLPVELQAIEIQ